MIRRVLRAFTVQQTVAFFREIGIRLHEEIDGKLFPDSNRARDVLNALVGEATRTGVTILTNARVTGVERTAPGFHIATTAGDVTSERVVLATGGRSLPKSGSDGTGYELAKSLGHTIVPTTPALVPLLLEGGPGSMHHALSGVAHDGELSLWLDDAMAIHLRGALLWTHFGISGPVTLNMSRHWLRASLERRQPRLTLNFCPGRTFDDVERWWNARTRERPQTTVTGQLASLLPASIAVALLTRVGLDGATTLAHLPRGDRRRLSHALVAWPLAVTGDRGYTYAEATAGGVSLDDIDPATMRSRVCDGLSLVGEILDVDGRIGGFNFHWAWSSAHVAAAALGT